MIKLVLRSLGHYWRLHLGVVLGAGCATAVLVGALVVGDSVRLSLRQQALKRIGGCDAALIAGERYFRADLAERMAQDLEKTNLAPMLSFRGIVRTSAGSSSAGIVDVFGVEERFFALSPSGTRRQPPAAGKALLNEPLAAQLGVGPGDSILLRVEKPSFMPRDMVMATLEDISFALRLEVAAVVDEEGFGRFGLRASQVPPFNLFVSLPWLQEQLELRGRANLLLLGNNTVDRANEVLRHRWTLADAELRLRSLEDSGLFELGSDRVFIGQAVAETVTRMEPGLLGALTYFVNTLRAGPQTTPYSMVSAIGTLSPGTTPRDPALLETLKILPEGLGEGGIVLNQWCAKDLQVKVGERVELSYFVMGPQLQLKKSSQSFIVRSVVPIAGPADDPGLMPEFPGLADVENCRDWEPGVPIDLERIRDVDEKYWDDHRGTPKAFLDLAAGQELWSNRFGSLTAIRGPQAMARQLETRLLRQLDPARIGLFFRDIRGPALAAGTSATDFGGLFLGLSFFLIASAWLLTSLLFVFGVEQRASEIGTLLAVGFRPRQVRRLFLVEALILAVVGGVLGAGLGMGYTKAVLFGLGSLWRDAVGATTLTFHARPETVALGALIALLAAMVAIALALRKAFHRPAVELLASRSGIPRELRTKTRGGGRISLAVGLCAVLLAVGLALLVGGGNSSQTAGAFFGAGALLLLGTLSWCRYLLTRLRDPGRKGITSVTALGLRNAGRRPGRSLATIALLASGTFLVVAVQANRLEPPQDSALRASGTGGFALFGRSTLPVFRSLATQLEDMKGVDIVPMRVREGDDASCLNLSLPQNPQLIGVQPRVLADRGAFRFSRAFSEEENPWLLLNGDFGEGVVPAIGDEASVTWTLHKKLGDTLDYLDEQGRSFRVRIVGTLANSILQGNLIVAEERLKTRFPSASGYRMFLIDAPKEKVRDVASKLTAAYEDMGLELTSTGERLAAFNAVQNTYLLIFQVLGGLGLLLGSLGVGMVVLRNTLERRSELAILSAMGYPSRCIRQLVWSEHGLLLGLGLASGVLAALFALLPSLGDPSGSLAWLPIVGLVVAVALSGAAWVLLASAFATRGPLLSALQTE